MWTCDGCGVEGKGWRTWVSHQAEEEPSAEIGDSSGIWKRFGVARVCDEWGGSGST